MNDQLIRPPNYTALAYQGYAIIGLLAAFLGLMIWMVTSNM